MAHTHRERERAESGIADSEKEGYNGYYLFFFAVNLRQKKNNGTHTHRAARDYPHTLHNIAKKIREKRYYLDIFFAINPF